MAGGLAGSVAVLVLKYIVEQYEFETMYLGIANVVANSLIMLRWVYYSPGLGGLGLTYATCGIAQWSYGSARTWRRNILTILLCKKRKVWCIAYWLS